MAELTDGFIGSQKKDGWCTPSWLTEILNRHVTINLDPCAGPPARTNIGRTNFRGKWVDGLDASWYGTVFLNPPFSEKRDWIDHCIDQYESGRLKRAIVLTPDSTDVLSWWHGQLAEYSPYVWFSEGRIGYVDPVTGEPANSPTFGTALNFIGEKNDWPDSLFHELSCHGDVCVRWEG